MKLQQTGQANWAELLKRSFAMEVLKCARCGGKMKLIATIRDLEVAKAFLESVGLPATPPTRASPRAPPQEEFYDSASDDFSQITAESSSFD